MDTFFEDWAILTCYVRHLQEQEAWKTIEEVVPPVQFLRNFQKNCPVTKSTRDAHNNAICLCTCPIYTDETQTRRQILSILRQYIFDLRTSASELAVVEYALTTLKAVLDNAFTELLVVVSPFIAPDLTDILSETFDNEQAPSQMDARVDDWEGMKHQYWQNGDTSLRLQRIFYVIEFIARHALTTEQKDSLACTNLHGILETAEEEENNFEAKQEAHKQSKPEVTVIGLLVQGLWSADLAVRERAIAATLALGFNCSAPVAVDVCGFFLQMALNPHENAHLQVAAVAGLWDVLVDHPDLADVSALSLKNGMVVTCNDTFTDTSQNTAEDTVIFDAPSPQNMTKCSSYQKYEGFTSSLGNSKLGNEEESEEDIQTVLSFLLQFAFDIYSPLPLFAVSLHGVGRMLLHPPPTATEPSSGPAILPNAEDVLYYVLGRGCLLALEANSPTTFAPSYCFHTATHDIPTAGPQHIAVLVQNLLIQLTKSCEASQASAISSLIINTMVRACVEYSAKVALAEQKDQATQPVSLDSFDISEFAIEIDSHIIGELQAVLGPKMKEVAMKSIRTNIQVLLGFDVTDAWVISTFLSGETTHSHKRPKTAAKQKKNRSN